MMMGILAGIATSMYVYQRFNSLFLEEHMKDSTLYTRFDMLLEAIHEGTRSAHEQDGHPSLAPFCAALGRARSFVANRIAASAADEAERDAKRQAQLDELTKERAQTQQEREAAAEREREKEAARKEVVRQRELRRLNLISSRAALEDAVTLWEDVIRTGKKKQAEKANENAVKATARITAIEAELAKLRAEA